MKNNNSNSNNSKNTSSTNLKCFNYDKPGHFIADYWRPKRDDKKSSDRKDKEDHRPSRKKKEQKALLAEESKSRWADSDSEESSSSDSEDEIITCLMAYDDEVFDFSSNEFTKSDLITALNDMIIEYRKLSDSFNEMNLKNKSDSMISQTNKTGGFKNDELSAENEILKTTVQNKNLENQRLNYVISAWTKSSSDIKQLHEQ